MKLKLLFALLIITTSNAQTQIGQDIVDTNREIFGLALSENGNVLAVSGTDYNYNPIAEASMTTGTLVYAPKQNYIADVMRHQIPAQTTASTFCKL